MNLAAGVERAAGPTIVGAADVYRFNPLTTAAMASVLCAGLFALRLLRRRLDADPLEDGSARATAEHFSAPPTTEPTEPPTQR